MSQSQRSSSGPLDAWCRKLTSSDTLVATRTVSDVNLVALDELTSASDLSRVVGHDVSMAGRLLRIASSALFDRQGRTVDTINAAIVRIGFDAIRELAVSLALIEQALSGEPHERVAQTMTRAFHAATQAKALAGLAKQDRLEEVFAAALLREMGAMLFWSRADSDGEQIEALQSAGMPDADAERQVLGFSLLELSGQLAQEWHLGELMKLSLDEESHASAKLSLDKQVQLSSVQLGHKIARLVSERGLDSKAVRELLPGVAEAMEIDEKALLESIETSAKESADIAHRYGMPKSKKPKKNSSSAQALAVQQPDPESQIRILQEIAQAIGEGSSLNDLVALVLKGIYQGLGFDRTYFALLSPDRQQLQCRYQLGASPPNFLNATRALTPEDRFMQTLDTGTPLRMHAQDLATDPEYAQWLSYSACALMPIIVQGKPVGLLYADRAASRRQVDDAAFRGFQLFGQQLTTILMTMSSAKP